MIKHFFKIILTTIFLAVAIVLLFPLIALLSFHIISIFYDLRQDICFALIVLYIPVPFILVAQPFLHYLVLILSKKILEIKDRGVYLKRSVKGQTAFTIFSITAGALIFFVTHENIKSFIFSELLEKITPAIVLLNYITIFIVDRFRPEQK